jgi:non-canonical poly(A) RNA polymerase PAPD5/7
MRRLHDEIVAYMSYITPTPQERTARQEVISCLEKLIKARLPQSKPRVEVFGSVAQDLCLPERCFHSAIISYELMCTLSTTSDIDLVISFPKTRSVKSLLFMCSKLAEDAQITHITQVNHWASVPVLKFQTTAAFGK